MRENKYIQVVWVEDDPLVTSAYPNEADMVADIELHPFPCWEDAEVELENNYEQWDAIILDAKCRYHKDDADKAEKFLSHVFPKIMTLASRKNRTIPWYVLSGQGEDDIRDLIPDTNEWDNSWFKLTNRRFYSKNGKIKYGSEERHERQLLFERIRTQVNHYNEELQTENDLYPDVFKALDDLDLAGEVGFHLMPLLLPIHFKGISNADYNRRYIDLRKALEYIFRHMVKKGILPANIISKKEKDSVNLTWSSYFLGGKQPVNLDEVKGSEKVFWTEIERLNDEPLLPKKLSQWLKETIFQTGGAAHTAEAEAEIAMNLDKYLPHVGGSPYMLRSLAMGLCDFILWYDNFLKAHPEKVKFWTLKGDKY